MKKRLLSILTALCLCLTLLPGTVLANEGSGAVLAEEGGEAETAVSPYSEVTITAHQPLKHAPVLGTLDASAVDETVTPRRGMFFYKGMSGVAEITDLTAYQAGEADSLRPIENQGEKYTPGKLYQLQLTFYTPLLLTGDVRFACNRRPVTVYDTPAEALQAMQAYDGKGDLCAAYIQRHENGMGDVEGDNYFLYLYWLLRIPDTVSTRAELIAALKDPAKTYIELSNGISLTTEDDVNHPVTYDITGKTITGGTINIHGNTIVTFAGKGTVYSKLSLWGGGATFSAPDAVINGDVDFGSYSGSLTGGTFNGDINCYYGTIKGGAFYGNITSSSGKTQITGGTFYGSVANCEIDESAKVSVTFDTGDSAVDTQRVLRGQKAEKPADPVKDGWRFTGWHSDGKEYDFTEPVTADTVLTANWMSTTTREVSTAEKLTAALSGTDGIVKLTDDITITEGLKIERDVTVDLNGHVLRYDEEAEPGSIFRVKSDCTLTLTDSRPEAEHEDESLPAGGLITGGKGYRHDGGSGGYHIYYYYGGGVYVEAGASFELAGGTIYACGVQSGANVAFGGGIYAEGGSVTMTGGAIRNCVLSANNGANGGGVYIYSGASFTMEGGVISGCSAMSGGGILTSGCTVRITGGRIENCKASKRGGGLSVSGHTNGPVSVLDTVISGCEAKRGGGVALISFAELELGENARITGCTATEKDDTEAGAIEYGAAIYMDLNNPLIVNYPGCFLYANGGRVEGTVYVGTNKIGTKNNYLDSVKATNAIDHTDGKPTTVFTGDVYCEGDIRGGIFHGSVTVLDPRDDMADVSKYNYWKFCSNLSGGSFYKPVRTECHVSGGTFYGGLTLEKNAKLSGKPMNTGSELTDKTNIPNPNGKPVTVTYAYGALGGIYAKQIVQAGETAKTPAEPTREGYTFIGWDKAIPATMPAENITITARWKDIEKPTGEIIIGTDKWQEFLNELTSGLFFKDTQEVTINAADNSGIVFASYLVTDQDLSEEELESLVYRGYDEPFRIEPNGEYIVYVMLVDASLNITYLRSDRLTLDNVQPVISGVENGKTYCGARTVTITEKYIDTVTVNGTTVELDESDSFRLAPANGGQKIIVADKAGNTTEMTVTVNAGHTYGEWASNGDGTHTRKCTVDGCAGSETKDCSGGKATCRDKAKCAVCGKTYGELDAKNHADLKHIPAKAATWVAEGNIEYWYCEGCGRYFSDRDGTKEIRKADTVTAKRKSSSAAAKPEDDPKSPGTGDTSNLALWIALLFASGGAAIGTTVVSRRKKYNR